MNALRTGVARTALLLACALAGCARTPAPQPPTLTPSPPLLDARFVPVFDSSGTPVTFDDLAAAAAAADVVFVGEIHGNPQGLAFAADLWDSVLAASGSAALSMEFFERDQQAGLDDYLRGVTDEEAFRKATGRTPSGYPPGHQRMVEAAKAAGAPVIAANAPRRYVRLARLEGYPRLESLTAEQQRLFDTPTAMPSESYRERFMGLRSGAAADPSHTPQEASPDAEAQRKTLEGFYRSQVLWDSTMAASVARAASDGFVPVVHIVGGFHVKGDGGTVELFRLARPDATVVTIIIEDATGPRDEDRSQADFIVYVSRDDPPS